MPTCLPGNPTRRANICWYHARLRTPVPVTIFPAAPAMTIASPSDYREIARRRLPPFLFHYIDGGAYAEHTLRRNVADLSHVALRQRVLKDMSQLDLQTTLFGETLTMPLALAPVGMCGMFARRGEVQAARAASQYGVGFTLSSVSVCAIEEVAAAMERPLWFQLYVLKDHGFTRNVLERAQAAGASVLFFTVDLPVTGVRYRDYHSGLADAAGLGGQLRRFAQALAHPRWALDVGLGGRPHSLGNLLPVLGEHSGLKDYFGWIGANFDPTVTWEDVAWVRERWKGPLIIKGILEPDDAQRAIALGADGLVVSNHGGRQHDGALSTARALPAIADTVGGQATILADGGVRSGLDVVRMLALGADGVLLGRAFICALAVRGQAGVSHVLDLIAAEMRVAMALSGVGSVKEIDRGILAA